MSAARRSVLRSILKLPLAALGMTKVASIAASERETPNLVKRAALAHEALMRGDIEQYRQLLTLGADFTLMAPFGGPPSRGGRYTEEQWAAIGRFFRDGRNSTLDLVQAYESPTLVVLVAIERSHVAVGNIPAQPWSLRVTLVFRRENDRWVLAHRHADPLVGEITAAQSAALAQAGR